MSDAGVGGASFEEFCEALRGQLRRSGFCKEAADVIMTDARSRRDWAPSPPRCDVPQEAIPVLNALLSLWSSRVATAFQAVVRLEAEIYYANFGFELPPGIKPNRPDWLTVIDGGKEG